MGCQTVFVSRYAVIFSMPGSSLHSVALGRTTRLRLSADASSSSAASASSSTPARSIALTSRCDASHGAISAASPVSTLTTPPGRSDVDNTSESVIAGSGRSYDDTTTTVLPETIAGATTLTRPSSEESCGATTATTPVGSGVDRLKCGVDTGFALPTTWASLSDQPAYHTQRSIAASTAFVAAGAASPSDALTSVMNWSRRPSSISAVR